MKKLFFTTLRFGVLNNLFVIVLEILENIEVLKETDTDEFMLAFEDVRPVILQIVAASYFKAVFVKNFMECQFDDLSLEQHHKADTFLLKKMLENHGCFDQNILTAKISQIPSEAYLSWRLHRSVLCLRVMNIFVAGCGQIMPWLTATQVLGAKNLKVYFAFIDYPFEAVPAVERAWELRRYDLLEIFLTRDCKFPEGFNIHQVLPHVSARFVKTWNQRRNLHQAVSERNIEEVSRILSKIKKVKRCYNELGEGVLATCLRNFQVEMYALLLQNKFKICDQYEKLLLALPKDTRTVIADKNMQFSTKLLSGPDDNSLLSKCWVTIGHFHQKYYAWAVNVFISRLEEAPELRQLLRLAEKCPQLQIVFDFKHQNVNIVSAINLKNVIGKFNKKTFRVAICARELRHAAGSLAHELAHLAMKIIYENKCKPFKSEDIIRQQQFQQVFNECRTISGQDATYTSEKLNHIFEFYNDEKFINELIVLVPEMLCDFLHDKNVIIEEAKTRCPKLFEYYYQYCIPDIDSALKDGKMYLLENGKIKTVSA